MGNGTAFKSFLKKSKAAFAVSLTWALIPSFSLGAGAEGSQPRPISNGAATPLPIQSVNSSITKLRTKVPKKKKKTNVEWRMRMAGKQWQNANERSQFAELWLDAKADHVLTDSLLMHAWVWGSLKSAYSQSQWGEVQGNNAYGILEGYVQVQPWEPLLFQVGILNQGKWDAPLLIDMAGFPGVLENVKFGKEYSIELRAQQAIPTSKSLSTQTETAEATPGFMMETVRVAAEPADFPVQGALYGGHWSFQNLPSQVAADADGMGNTLVLGANGKPHFRYEFEGWLAGGSTKFVFSKQVSMNLRLQMMQNMKAPETYRNGQQAGGGFEFKLPAGIELSPSFDTFFAESDLSPANYQQTETGHGNRVGWWASLATTFRNQGFKIAGVVYDADTINPSATQTRQQYFMLRFETLYGSI